MAQEQERISLNRKIMSRRVLILFCITLELLLIGQYINVLGIGYYYGVNPKWLTFKSEEGLFPFFYSDYPFGFSINDRNDSYIIASGYSVTYLSDTIIKEIESYAIHNDSILVKVVDNMGDNRVLRPGKEDLIKFDELTDYPENSSVFQVSGNFPLFRHLYILQKQIRFYLILVLFCHFLFTFIPRDSYPVTRRRKQ